MKIIAKSMQFMALSLVAGSIYATSCSFKVINHADRSFEEMKIKATIGNLLISLCTQNPRVGDDEKTQINCATNPENTLYTHPMYEETCKATKGWPVYVQFEDEEKTCYSKETDGRVARDLVLNYPEDFNCSN